MLVQQQQVDHRQLAAHIDRALEPHDGLESEFAGEDAATLGVVGILGHRSQNAHDELGHFARDQAHRGKHRAHVLDRRHPADERHRERRVRRTFGRRLQRLRELLHVNAVGDDLDPVRIGAVGDLRIAVLPVERVDARGLGVAAAAHHAEVLVPELAEVGRLLVDDELVLLAIANPVRRVDLDTALLRVDAVFGEDHAAVPPRARDGGEQAGVTGRHGVVHAAARHPLEQQLDQRLPRKGPRPEEVQEALFGRLQLVALHQRLPERLRCQHVVGLQSAEREFFEPPAERGKRQRIGVAQAKQLVPQPLQRSAVATHAKRRRLPTRRHQAILLEEHDVVGHVVGRPFAVVVDGRCDMDQAEGLLRHLGDQPVHPRRDPPHDERVGAFEHEHDVRAIVERLLAAHVTLSSSAATSASSSTARPTTAISHGGSSTPAESSRSATSWQVPRSRRRKASSARATS